MRLSSFFFGFFNISLIVPVCVAFAPIRNSCRQPVTRHETILSSVQPPSETTEDVCSSRRMFFGRLTTGSAALIAGLGFSDSAFAAEVPALQESLDIDNFLRTGMEAQPMGVSGQAGKSRPETGVFLRDGTSVSRDSRSGNVLAEIVLGKKTDLSAVLVSFASPWPLAKGTVFDVECRDAKSGDGAFLAVTGKVDDKDINDLPTSFFLDQLFAPTGRFSFYGSPTNIKVKKSTVDGNKRIIEFSFSNLSQSTNAEIPRNAMLIATIPSGVDQAVMLIGSASASRWKNKGIDATIRKTIDSFNASPSPKTSLKVRAQEKGNSELS